MRRNHKKKKGGIKSLGRLFTLLRLAKKHKLITSSIKVKRKYGKGISPRDLFKQSKNLGQLGKRMREFFQDAGPTFIKFGQLLGLQIDILPKEIYEELEKLQDKVPGFSPEKAKKIIEQELNQPIEEIFDDFEDEPIAAASLAQVHKAKLKSGETVAVKILRPDIEKTINKDISLIKFLSKFVNLKKINLTKKYLEKTIREFEDAISLELELEVEARNMDRIKNTITDKKIKIPKVYSEYVTSKVLTMEWIDCVKITNFKKVNEWKLDKEKIFEKTLEIYLKQMLIFGLFHADPHPANIGITKKGEIVLFDFGAVGSVNKKYRKASINMVNAMLELDAEKYIEYFLKANKLTLNDVDDYEGLVEEIDYILSEYNRSVFPTYNEAASEIIKIFNKHNLKDIHDYVLMVRTLIILGSIAKAYNFSDRDSLEVFKKIAGMSLKEDIKDVINLKNASQQVSWANKNMRNLLENPKDFLEKNMPVLTMKRAKEEKKEKEDKEKKDIIRINYRSFGIFKYPFISLLLFLAGYSISHFAPELSMAGNSLSTIFYYATAVVLGFNIIYLMYLDFLMDRRVEVYKYPFISLVFIGIGAYLLFNKPEINIAGYPSYIYLFVLAGILVLYSLFQTLRIIKHKLSERIKEEFKKNF